jgi:transposase
MSASRQEILKFHYDHGVSSVKDLIKLSGLSRAQVYRYLPALKSGKKLNNKENSGRRRVLSSIDHNRIARVVVCHPTYSAQRIATVINTKGSPLVSHDTVYRYLKSKNWICKVPKTIPNLTSTHKTNRVKFATDNINNTFLNTVFTDESYFQLHRNTVKVWSKVKTTKPTPKHGPSVMIWGGFSIRGTTTLYIGHGSINSEKYCQILNENLLPTINVLHPEGWTLMQDNATCHTSLKTKSWLKENEVAIMSWPACSPDLNPIENIWGLMKNKLERTENLNTSNWISQIQEIWDNLSHDLLRNLVNSMTRRLNLVIEANGDKIDY